MIRLSTFLFLNVLVLTTFAQKSFSLDEAVDFAYSNSNAIKLKQIETQDAHSEVNEYKAIGLPTVSAGLGYQYYFKTPASPVEDFVGPSVYQVLFAENVIEPRELGPPDVFKFSFVPKNNLTGNIDANWLLFDGSYLSGLKAAKLYKELVAKGINITKQEIKSNVTKAYLAILVAEKNLEIVDLNLANLSKSTKEVQALYDNGFAEQLDVDRLTLSGENLSIQKENLLQLITLSYNLLKFQMGHPIEQEITLSEDLDQLINQIIIEDLDIYGDVDFTKRAEYESINLGIELNELNHQRIGRTNLPSLKAFASVSESLQRNNLFDSNEAGLIPTAVVGLNLNIPIFDGNLRKSQLQQSELAIEKTKIEKQEFERAVQLQTSNARIGLINARKSLNLQKKVLDLNQKIYDVQKIKFKEGVGSSFELSQAESALYQAQSAYINALYEFIISKTDLDIATGQL